MELDREVSGLALSVLGESPPRVTIRIDTMPDPTYRSPPKIAGRKGSEPEPGLLQRLAARETWRLILLNMVPEEMRAKSKKTSVFRHPVPGMNKVKKAFRSQRHVKPIAKIDYNLSIPIMYPYTVPPAFTNIIRKLVDLKTWLNSNWFVKDCIIHLWGDEIVPRKITGLRKILKNTLINELETTLYTTEELADSYFLKFVMMLVMNTTEAVLGLYDDKSAPSFPNAAGFFKHLLPDLGRCNITSLRIINISVGSCTGFRNLLKLCPSLIELECRTESSGNILHIGSYAQNLRRLTLLGKPKHMPQEVFADSFFGIQDLSSGCSEDWCRLQNLQYIHLIDAIHAKQIEFLMLLSRYAPSLRRVWSNYRNLPLRKPLVKFSHKSKLEELYLDIEGITCYTNKLTSEVNFMKNLKAINLGAGKYTRFSTKELSILFSKMDVTKVSIIFESLKSASDMSYWNEYFSHQIVHQILFIHCFSAKILNILDMSATLRLLKFLRKIRYFTLDIEGLLEGHKLEDDNWQAKHLEFLGFRAIKSCVTQPTETAVFLNQLIAKAKNLKILRVQVSESVLTSLKKSLEDKRIKWPKIKTLKLGLERQSAETSATAIVSQIESIEHVVISGNYKQYLKLAMDLRYSAIKVTFEHHLRDDGYEYY